MGTSTRNLRAIKVSCVRAGSEANATLPSPGSAVTLAGGVSMSASSYAATLVLCDVSSPSGGDSRLAVSIQSLSVAIHSVYDYFYTGESEKYTAASYNC